LVVLLFQLPPVRDSPSKKRKKSAEKSTDLCALMRASKEEMASRPISQSSSTEENELMKSHDRIIASKGSEASSVKTGTFWSDPAASKSATHDQESGKLPPIPNRAVLKGTGSEGKKKGNARISPMNQANTRKITEFVRLDQTKVNETPCKDCVATVQSSSSEVTVVDLSVDEEEVVATITNFSEVTEGLPTMSTTFSKEMC
jgi:hypothetical protein